MIGRIKQTFLGSVATLLLVGSALASTPVTWEQSSQRDFLNGKPTRISIGSDGRLLLAPSVEGTTETSEPLIWCLGADSRGNSYVGTGNDGKLLKIDSSGKSTVFFDAAELEIHSVVVDGSDNVFAATFPVGKIYKLNPSGQATVYFDPAQMASADSSTSTPRYIWSIALDKSGNLYAGTGENGRIYKIDRNGRPVLFAETGETHVVALTIDPAGNLIAGTDPAGRIYRITPSGKLSVLLDSPYQEIHTLVLDGAGYLYAGALNEPRITSRSSVQPPTSTVTTTASSGSASGDVDVGVIEVTAASDGNTNASGSRPFRSGSGMVYRISPDGVVQEWWLSRDEVCLALALRNDGALLVGTNSNGRLYAVRADGKSTVLLQLSEPQITALMRTPSGHLMLGTSNMAKIYRLGAQPARDGIYESEIKDTRGASAWGRLSWIGNRPPGTGLQFFARSGNTDRPDNTWSDWAGPYSSAEGDPITCPSARYIQWKVLMTTTTDASPELSRLAIAYLTRNVAPTINSVTVYEPGVYFRETTGEERMDEDLPPKTAIQINNRSGAKRQPGAGATAYRKGMRAIAIDANDANDDALKYAVYFRGERETLWKLLKDELDRPGYSWDSETLPDGFYTLKIVVNDGASNPSSLTLAGEMESAPLVVDNTGPVVLDIVADRRVLTFSVQDAASSIFKVEYAVDGGDWRLVYPKDGVTDARLEAFQISLTGLAASEHTIAIRAKDTSNNVGTGKRVLVLQ